MMRRILVSILFRVCGDSFKATTCSKSCLCLPTNREKKE